MDKKSSRDNDERRDSSSSNVDKPDENTSQKKVHKRLKRKQDRNESKESYPEKTSDEDPDEEKPNDEDGSVDEHADREESPVEGAEGFGASNEDDSSELSSSLDEEEIDELERSAEVWKGKQKAIGQRYKKPDDLWARKKNSK